MKISIFICPEWVKNKRELEYFFKSLSDGSNQKISIVFNGNTIEDAINFADFFQDIDIKFEKIIFEDVTFKEYVRFIDIQCEEMEFLYVKFERGGALKNRKGKFGIDIGNLIFKPSQIENAFVIDLGNYANEEGFLETEKIGRIRNIEFENHKEGKGQIYFIGINQHTELADFRNKILDNVSFQNSDLSSCYFLNAKVDKAEFRNCTFPEIRNHKYVNGLSGRREAIYLMMFFPFIVMVLSIMLFGAYALKIQLIFYVYLLILPFYMLLILWSLNAFFHPLEYWISFYSEKRKENLINSVKSYHYHYGIADENNINIELQNLRKDNKKDTKFLQNRKKLQASYFNLIELYRQLKENFDKSDFQTAGNFFYAQRYIEMISTTFKKSWMESWVLNIHYMVNGFGERFIRPLILLIGTVIIFSITQPYVNFEWIKALEINKDFVATSNTPLFLLEGYDDSNKSLPVIIDVNNSEFIKVLNGDKRGLFLDKKLENNTSTTFYIPKLKDNWHTRFYYSLNHIILPFMSENRQWFKEVSQKAIFFGYLESALLWLFGGAFVLALFHRIKR